MNQAQFADLIGVSPQQVSKYVASGAVLVEDGRVNVADSLMMLEGRLDEEKRQRALAKLEGANPVRQPSPPNQGSGGQRTATAKQEKDAIDRDLRLLEYGQKAGDLVLAEDVEATAQRAVAEMREVFNNGRREDADLICSTFGVAPEKSGALARFLGTRFEAALGRFSAVMATLASEAPEATAQDEYAEAL